MPTKIEVYKNEKDLKKGTERLAREGWEVLSVESVEQGYSGKKTCCWGLIFLPLALLGKRKPAHRVVFQKKL